MEQKGEVKQVSEREIWIGENRMYLGKDNIIYVTAVGEIDEKIAVECKEAMFNLINMVEEKANYLIDLNKGGKTSPAARKIFNELNEHEKAGKIAFFGLHPVARVLASFIGGTSKKKDIQFFKTKEGALAWLKGDNNG